MPYRLSGPAGPLPEPPPQELAIAALLAAEIRARIDRHGPIPFAEYMQTVLYHPRYGYYSSGHTQFGAAGDFVTAPELSPLFARGVAANCAPVLEHTGGDILEFGAGSGRLACDLLGALEARGRLPGHYLILEVSAALRARQQETLAGLDPHLAGRVAWIDALPDAFTGVVLANEVLDAMPVQRLVFYRTGARELRVANAADGFAWQAAALDDAALREAARRIRRCLDDGQPTGWPEGYTTEVNLNAAPWIRALADRLTRGLLLISDYGYPACEYYHPARHDGTLRCHYRHHAHADPLILAGIQDVTAHVDFSLLADSAAAAGLDVAGFTAQGGFLLASGLLDELASAAAEPGSPAYIQLVNQVRQLTLPGEMGEAFKVLALSRDLAVDLPGFSQHDQRYRL